MPNSGDEDYVKNKDQRWEESGLSEENQAKKERFVSVFALIFLPNLSFIFLRRKINVIS